MPSWIPNRVKKIHKWYARFHTMHHINAFPENDSTEKVEEYIHVPLYGKIAASIGIIATMPVSVGLACGIIGFFIVYSIRHGTIHGVQVLCFKPASKDSKYYRHHMSHHKKGNWNKHNFSGVHAWVDKLFGTYSAT